MAGTGLALLYISFLKAMGSRVEEKDRILRAGIIKEVTADCTEMMAEERDKEETGVQLMPFGSAEGQMDLGSFSALPNEVIGHIFTVLESAAELCSLGAACKLFYCFGKEESLWRSLCVKHFAVVNRHASEFGKDWRWIYLSYTVSDLSSSPPPLFFLQSATCLSLQWQAFWQSLRQCLLT